MEGHIIIFPLHTNTTSFEVTQLQRDPVKLGRKMFSLLGMYSNVTGATLFTFHLVVLL